MLGRRILVLVSSLITIIGAGCGRPADPPKPALISVPQPDLTNTTEFMLPAGGPKGDPRIPSIAVRLPKGSSFSAPFVLKTPDGETVNITPMPSTHQSRQEYLDLKAALTKPLAQDLYQAGDWLGTLQKLSSGSSGENDIYSMFGKDASYTLNIAATAGQDPAATARGVLWSYKELK